MSELPPSNEPNNPELFQNTLGEIQRSIDLARDRYPIQVIPSASSATGVSYAHLDWINRAKANAMQNFFHGEQGETTYGGECLLFNEQAAQECGQYAQVSVREFLDEDLTALREEAKVYVVRTAGYVEVFAGSASGVNQGRSLLPLGRIDDGKLDELRGLLAASNAQQVAPASGTDQTNRVTTNIEDPPSKVRIITLPDDLPSS